MVLYYIYTLIMAYLVFILGMEFFHEKKWKIQLAIAFVLLIFVLRILQVK